tara:strand:+ start:475 stop:717 length:243 start_codon:yes stop_codon:yes gene_type:complete
MLENLELLVPIPRIIFTVLELVDSITEKSIFPESKSLMKKLMFQVQECILITIKTSELLVIAGNRAFTGELKILKVSINL